MALLKALLSLWLYSLWRSGIAAAVKLSGSHARVVGVEPEGAQSMLTSLDRGEVSMVVSAY